MFAKTFGCCRYLWNRMLSDNEYHYKEMGTILGNTPANYKDDPDCLWLSEVDSMALINVQLQLNNAYNDFFNGAKGLPKLKKKSTSNSYTTNWIANNIKLNGNLLKLPKLKQPVKMILHRDIKPGGNIKAVTISQESNGAYYASILFEYPKKDIQYIADANKTVGLDMSMKELYVSSDGELGNYPRFYRKSEEKITKEQRKLSRMQKGSKNYEKQRIKIATLYVKTKHQREDYLHKKSRSLVDRYDIVSIEDLDMKAMSQSLSLGKSVGDNGWGMFTRMLEYKLAEKGGRLIKIDKWFPSSKTCSKCGHKHERLSLSDRIYICPECGNIIDRDLQAAINIKQEGLRILASA